jgi:hypothetical protein
VVASHGVVVSIHRVFFLHALHALRAPFHDHRHVRLGHAFFMTS